MPSDPLISLGAALGQVSIRLFGIDDLLALEVLDWRDVTQRYFEDFVENGPFDVAEANFDIVVNRVESGSGSVLIVLDIANTILVPAKSTETAENLLTRPLFESEGRREYVFRLNRVAGTALAWITGSSALLGNNILSPETKNPTAGPTSGPTSGPTPGPTTDPTVGPTTSPTSGPIIGPTTGPTASPTSGPTTGPTARPSPGPSERIESENISQEEVRFGNDPFLPLLDPTSGPAAGPTVEPTAGSITGPTSTFDASDRTESPAGSKSQKKGGRRRVAASAAKKHVRKRDRL